MNTKLWSDDQRKRYSMGYETGQLYLLVELIDNKILDYTTAINFAKTLEFNYYSDEDINNFLNCYYIKEFTVNEYINVNIKLAHEKILKISRDSRGYYLEIEYNDKYSSVSNDRFRYNILKKLLDEKKATYIESW